mmetsp:Transcript_74224/g.108864  ORF Transcript_74224/g.108864 Transcript_74224/m.108864 type:complete len:285 (+) Transcript_74224:48-902(+)|eukprot:CAMPEP_0179429178 /NCGR_PEP_ID=MMETSP0799-20121207/14636_1 /TAXON_ID=46947 /ORGANISM="Geminigera cryophila, Strain CCMP2564" /LENGTH=284 /DNA_ID=CAMNT_0021204985 /DNA_START=44 /DNA_END=898 /DNA_ORIENTATION=-
MDWLRNAAAAAQNKAQEVSKQAQDKLKESGMVEKLAPMTSAASDTKTLFSQFGSSIESSFNAQVGGDSKSGKEGDVSFDKIGPPWVTSHLGLKPFEADMKASMLKITEGADEEVKARFKEEVADDDFDFDFLEPSSTARAMAALEADTNLKAARHKLVPGKVKENDFWRCYFWKCDIIIQSYLKMCVADKGKIADRYPDPTDNVDFLGSSSDAAAFASDDIVNTAQTSDTGLTWEEEMAKELEGIESGGAPASNENKPVTPGATAMAKAVDDLDDDDFEKELGL